MGLVIKVLHNQRVFIGDKLWLEVSKYKGRFQLHFQGEKPFEFEINREPLEEYRSRMGEQDESEVHSVQPCGEPAGSE